MTALMPVRRRGSASSRSSAASSCRSSRRATSGSARRCRRASRSSSRRSTSGACATSCAAARRTARACTDENRKHPEVVTVISQLGRPDDGTDVSGFQNIELFAPLRPFDEWKQRPHEGEAHRRAVRGARRGVPGRRLQLLADDLRQRRRGDERRQGRELGQGRRPRRRREREERARDRRHDGRA